LQNRSSAKPVIAAPSHRAGRSLHQKPRKLPTFARRFKPPRSASTLPRAPVSVYMEPGSYEIYKKTKVFPEGTILFKELQLTLPRENADGSRNEPSGRGYFPGALNGADVTVKDSKRFANTGGWGYFNFNHSEPKAPTAKVKAKEECAFCHIASAKKDEVWTQFYRLLDN
jgi:hypothetical protein